MASKSSAVAGAVIAQIMYLVVDMPSFHAAWGWKLSPPADMPFSCAEGAEIGGGQGTTADDFKCTVNADSGYKCDVAQTMVVCNDPTKDFTDAVPVEVMCLNIGHNAGQADNDNTSSLSWKPVPTCTECAHPSCLAGFTVHAGHACRKDAEGTEAGEEGTDYIKLNKGDGEVNDVAHCGNICAKYEETNGQACHGIEYTHGGDSTLDYCEIWLVKPEGTAVSETHSCDVYVKPADHGDHDHNNHNTGEPDVGAAEKTTVAPSVDASSSSIVKLGLVSCISTILMI